MLYHEVVIVGGGLAGLRAAVESSKYADTAVVSQLLPVRSHTTAAQGGINAPLGNHPEGKDDSLERHTWDTVRGSDFLSDQDAVEIFIKEATRSIIELDHWGVPFSRFEDGTIAQRPFGGGGFPRTCYAADRTGLALMHTLYEQVVKHEIPVYYERQVMSLAVGDGAVLGVVALNLTNGELEFYQAKAVVFATGGSGRVYSKTSNSLTSTGLGMAITYWSGVCLKDMEFVQFHPTTLYGTNILISEAARGEGGYLLNNKGERFMQKYAPKAMELAPRDIVSRSIQTEIAEGRGFENEYVHLDLRHLGEDKINERLPQIRDLAIKFAGVDPVKDPIPIQPGAHYIMGGIDTNSNGETLIKGFYAAGECACVSVHGANRLGGNSLLECVVFGKITGEHAGKYAKEKAKKSERKVVEEALSKADRKVEGIFRGDGDNNPFQIMTELRNTMTETCFIFRQEKPVAEGLNKIRELKKKFKNIHLTYKDRKYNLELARVLEVEGMLEVAETITLGALMRTESRGSHSRVDYAGRDDVNWLKHTLFMYTPEGPQVSFKPVVITRWRPEERKY